MSEILFLAGFGLPFYGLVVWFFTMCMSSHVAEQKGGPAGWFLLWGFLFGPLALLAAVGLPDRKGGTRRLPVPRSAAAITDDMIGGGPATAPGDPGVGGH